MGKPEEKEIDPPVFPNRSPVESGVDVQARIYDICELGGTARSVILHGTPPRFRMSLELADAFISEDPSWLLFCLTCLEEERDFLEVWAVKVFHERKNIKNNVFVDTLLATFRSFGFREGIVDGSYYVLDLDKIEDQKKALLQAKPQFLAKRAYIQRTDVDLPVLDTSEPGTLEGDRPTPVRVRRATAEQVASCLVPFGDLQAVSGFKTLRTFSDPLYQALRERLLADFLRPEKLGYDEELDVGTVALSRRLLKLLKIDCDSPSDTPPTVDMNGRIFEVVPLLAGQNALNVLAHPKNERFFDQPIIMEKIEV